MMKRNVILLNLLLALVLVISGCSGGKSPKPNTAAPAPAGAVNAKFPVNETFAAELTAEGIPADLARFFAAAKIEATNPTPNTFVYNLFYPNGSTREITMKFTPGQTHTLTQEEIAKNSADAIAVYDFKYNSTLGPDWKGRLDMQYFAPNEGIPAELLRSLKQSASRNIPKDLLAILKETVGLGSVKAAAGDSVPGVTIAWGESTKTGVDVAISSLIDAAKAQGVSGAGKVAGIYALASAASALGGAMVLSQQNSKWLTELDALEECAANPTNQVAKSDPNYSKNAQDKVQSARSELTEVNAVRFLNQATETAAGITPATSVASIALKQGFLYGEQGLGDYSENTIMREARLAIVPCGDENPPPEQGNVTLKEEWTEPATGRRGIVNSVANVRLVYNKLGYYDIVGTLKYEETITESGFTYKKSVTGDAVGMMYVIDDLNQAKLIGYGYAGGGSSSRNATRLYTTTDPKGNSRTETRTGTINVEWAFFKGFKNPDGSIEGVLTVSMDIPDVRKGTRTIAYKFGAPPPRQ